MSKVVRFVAAAVLILGILLLAQSQLASANRNPQLNMDALQSGGAAAPARAPGEPGTVKPPPVVVPPINQPGVYSVGGICTVIVERLDDSVSLHANLLPFNVVHNPPSEIQRYLAGVCNLKYVKAGKGITDLAPEDGSVKVCFASIPNMNYKIYVYDDRVWVALETTLENGLACAPATKSARYLLVQLP